MMQFESEQEKQNLLTALRKASSVLELKTILQYLIHMIPVDIDPGLEEELRNIAGSPDF